jgi:hypothetical protein
MADLILPAVIAVAGFGASAAAILAFVWIIRAAREFRAMSRSDWRF